MTGIIFPLYIYPDSSWQKIIAAKVAHPNVPIIAIINPNSGVGASSDPNYAGWVGKLKASAIMVLGYVATGYASRSPTDIKAEIDNYFSWYGTNGIFFDEMKNTAGSESYYSVLSSYTKQKGMTITVGNPGTTTIPSYIGTVDNLTIYEDPGMPSAGTIRNAVSIGGQASNFSYIAFAVPSLDLTTRGIITATMPLVSYLFITSDVTTDPDADPYDSIPPYFADLVALLDTSSTQTSLSGIKLSWTAPADDGGSPISEYMIERSLDGGTSWSSVIMVPVVTTYIDTGVASGITYTYRVSAINAAGTSQPSNTASATTGNSKPISVSSPPSGLTVSSL